MMRQLSQHLFQPFVLGSLLAIGLGATPAHAQQPATERAGNTISIPAEPMAKALDALGAQTGVAIMYSPGLVEGLQSKAVSGPMSVSEALSRLLQGSGIGFTSPNPQTFVLRREPVRQGAGSGKTPASTQAGSSVGTESEPKQLAGMLVVGSRLGASQYESAQPTVLISRQDIEHSGAGTVAGVLAQRPEVSVNNIGDNVGTSGNFNGATVQLRGMPRGSTLVLVNGRRIGNSAAQSSLDFFDLNSIPLALVDHIEILPVGSSAIYGGDALAGVVNIVLKKDAHGFDINQRHSYARGYVENETNLTWGKSWSRGSLTVSGSYRKNSGLDESERAITADKDYRRFGGGDHRSPVTTPGNVFSLAGCPPAPSGCYVPIDERGNLPGLDAPYAGVPAGSSGENLTPGDFAATAGTLNKSSFIAPIFMPAKRYGLLVNGRFQLTPSIELFTEMAYSHNEVFHAGTPVSLNGQYGSYRVPADNPYNPFGVEVGVNFVVPGRPDSTLESEYLRTLFGARGGLGKWDWELAAWQSRNTADQINYFNTADAIREALASTDPATALNPFQDGPGGSEALRASFFNSTKTPYTTKLRGANGFIRGPLMDLPAGPLEALLGGEYEHQSLLYTSTFSGSQVKGSRNKQALFSEFRIPVLPGRNDSKSPMLSINGALRADRDSSFEGTGVTKTFGIEYRPTSTLLVRGSWNTAFKPPILYQASIDSYQYSSSIRDPKHNNEYVPVLIRTAGVPESIKPERGTSTTLGFVYSPKAVPLNFTMSWWRNRIHDRITGIGAQYLVDHEDAFPGRVIRDQSGTITAIDDRVANITFINESGVDLGLSGTVRTMHGTFYPEVAVTETYEYQTQLSPTLPVRDGVSKAVAAGYAPRWKGLIRMGWQSGGFFGQLTSRYISQYRDFYPATTTGEYFQLGDFWLFDVSLQYAIGKTLVPNMKWLSTTTVSLSVLNLFDRKPDYSDFAGNGYDASQYDIRGRYTTANLKVSF